jgi:hypothetical protein
MMNPWHGCECPKCKSTQYIDVYACVWVWVRLTNTGSDAGASGDGRHDWDDRHEAICVNCCYSGYIVDFKKAKR